MAYARNDFVFTDQKKNVRASPFGNVTPATKVETNDGAYDATEYDNSGPAFTDVHRP